MRWIFQTFLQKGLKLIPHLFFVKTKYILTQRWLPPHKMSTTCSTSCFNTQPPEGGCSLTRPSPTPYLTFQHTAARRRLRNLSISSSNDSLSFNTQPPEGGCNNRQHLALRIEVSTHSRPKAAALLKPPRRMKVSVSTHSRPKAAAQLELKAHLLI